MATQHQLTKTLWKIGLRVGVFPARQTPNVDIFPIQLPDNLTAKQLESKLSEVSGRLGSAAIRGAWLKNRFYSLEVPRLEREVVNYHDFTNQSQLALPWLLGLDNYGQKLFADVAKMPHALVAGETGAGKSNSVTAALAHLATYRTPQQVQFVLIDPKRVDLSPFADTPHALAHVVEGEKIVNVLSWLVGEMNRRYQLFSQHGARGLAGYNHKSEQPLPSLLCVIDELGLLMDTQGKELEPLLLTLLQTARASGIHLIIGTQRPDSDTIKPRLRANLPVRICFKVFDANSSRLIIGDESGIALLGAGDGMVVKDGQMERFQAPYISDEALQNAMRLIKQHPPIQQKISMQMSEPAKDDFEDVGKPASRQPVKSASRQYSKGNVGMSVSQQVSKPATDKFIVNDTLSQLENAINLCVKSDWISAGDLLKNGVVSSRSQGKKIMTELRKRGYIGGHDRSHNSSPVVMGNDQHVQHVHGVTTTNGVADANDQRDHDDQYVHDFVNSLLLN